MEQPINNISPSATIIRVRRKRNAEPITGLIVSMKRTRNNSEAVNGQRSMENLFYHRLPDNNKLNNLEKVVEVLDYDVEKKTPTGKEIKVFDENYRKLLEAVKFVKMMDISEAKTGNEALTSSSKESKPNDVEMESAQAKAPLAEPEDDLEYVYDLYWTSKDHVLPMDDLNVRLPTDDELKLYFGFEDVDDSNGEDPDDDVDSNAENYYKNDYPDEEQFNGENETTDSDDSYDHYGDKYEEYEDYCYGSLDE